jgi:hypothetical protein
MLSKMIMVSLNPARDENINIKVSPKERIHREREASETVIMQC